jgi:hypothetical protein
MGNRIPRWIGFLDMEALVVAIAVASLFVFSTALPWTAGTPDSIWPFLDILFAGETIGPYLSYRFLGKDASRLIPTTT